MPAYLILIQFAEYADLHGKLLERRVWNILLDLTQVIIHSHIVIHVEINY